MGSSTGGCKVDRMAEKYGLRGLDPDLERRHESGESLRTLARFVNSRILERELDRAGGVPHGDPGGIYDLLTGDDVDEGARAELETNLEQAGVSVADLREDFVSHVTVRSHLADCLDRETGRTSEITVEDANRTVDWARTRLARVVERTMERLRDADLLSISEISVFVTVTVSCTECGENYTPEELVGRGECGCRSPDVEGDGT